MLEILVFMAAICGPAEECYIIPDPTDGTAKSYILEVCAKDVEPHEQNFFTSGGEVYHVRAFIKPAQLCSSHNRPPDGLDELNKLPQ